VKATLFIIENERNHAEARALIEKLMGSSDAAGHGRMTAQARLIEAYERARWPRRIARLPDLLSHLRSPVRPCLALRFREIRSRRACPPGATGWKANQAREAAQRMPPAVRSNARAGLPVRLLNVTEGQRHDDET
jgi:hypothetical protein